MPDEHASPSYPDWSADYSRAYRHFYENFSSLKDKYCTRNRCISGQEFEWCLNFNVSMLS